MLNIVYRDAPWVIAAVFIFLVWIMLPHLNPPAQEAAAEPPGNLIVNINWPEGDTDVDVWLDGPGEPVPVGYSNKGGVGWNLLRDDLGNSPDATPFNYEAAFYRGIVPGGYTINLHCFRCPILPVPVDVEIQLNNGQPGKASMKVIATSKVVLSKTGQERTALNFKMDANGNATDMNTVFRPLRSGRK